MKQALTQIWDEMKENAIKASGVNQIAGQSVKGGLRIVAEELRKYADAGEHFEIHLVGHSTGAVMHGPFSETLVKDFDLRIKSLVLMASACTMKFFHNRYHQALTMGYIEKAHIFNLKKQTELDDNVAGIYHKSLLWLIARALERGSLLSKGVPLLGIQEFVEALRPFDSLNALHPGRVEVVLSPVNSEDVGHRNVVRAESHGGFATDIDNSAMCAAVARILGRERVALPSNPPGLG